MRSSRETRIANIICILLVLLAGFVRLLSKHYEACSYNGFILVLMSGAIVIWAAQLRRRLLQPHVRRNLMMVAFMMILWMAIRTVKYEFFWDGHMTVRYAWYLFYIPLTLIPLLLFLSVLYIGKPHERDLNPRWNLLYIPGALLVAAVLTNDWHQLAFSFPHGLAEWHVEAYVHGPVYYGVVAWMGILFVAMLVLVFVRCAVPANRGKIWIPMLPLLLAVVYTILYIVYQGKVFVEMYTMPEISCFFFASFMEGLIRAHLFPSNDFYEDFWNASSIGAGIMDWKGVICDASLQSIPVTGEEVRQAEDQVVLLEDGSIALRSHPIQGGYCYWIKELTEINQLNQKLQEMGNVLAEENAMLEAENKMREQETRIRRQSALYDDIARKVSPKLDEISRLLQQPDREEENFIRQMEAACILNAFVKRYSNLLLLFRQNKEIDMSELGLAVLESLDYVQLYGVKVHCVCKGHGLLPGEWVLYVYELFEAVLESAIPGANVVLVNMELQEDRFSLQMEINEPGESFLAAPFVDRMPEDEGVLKVSTEQKTEYISLLLPIKSSRYDLGGEGM